jgi:dihydrofolate synthase/folylpolyglutamate synthase
MQSDTAYRDALKYLYSLTDYERKGLAAYAPENYNLDRVVRLLSLLGNPQEKYKVVHIAGTKGKGSTAAMIESVLRASGHRTGLYTSPHLHTFRERIQAGGELIPEEAVVRLIEQMLPALAQLPDVTTFEVMTGLGFSWFAEQGVEWAVVEVGLGGRLDATNVVTPAVAVITSISLDHTAILGDTHKKIATEKAGIIKPGVAVVSAPQTDEALDVIESACRQQGAHLTVVGNDWTWQVLAADLDGQTFTVSQHRKPLGEFRIPLLGFFQLENATIALAVLSELQRQGIAIPEWNIREGLASVRWPGRLELLGRSPFVVADSAHNGDSARKLMTAVQSLFGSCRLTVLLGASSDHVTPGLLEAFLGPADRAIATKTRHPRAAKPVWIQSHAADLGYDLEISPDIPQALDQALQGVGPADLIVCTGSVFVAAEARAAWFVRQSMDPPPTDPI